MKLVTYHCDSSLRVGVLLKIDGFEFVLDLNKANPEIPSDMMTYIRMGEQVLNLSRQVIETPDMHACNPVSEVRLGPPVPYPSKIICLGLNYQDHAPKGDQSAQAFPTIFAKYNNSIIGTGDPIIIPTVTDQVDFEAELLVVIGKQGKNIPFHQTMDYVLGYSAFNDVSARDYQARTSQWLQGKTFDTFGPMGPVLVTSDEIEDPGNLDISLILNSQIMQQSNTSHLIFPISQIIAYLSQIMTLEPGDVISTGTPAGIGILRDPPVLLKAGDKVEVHIEGLGVLTNPVANATDNLSSIPYMR